MSYTNSMVAHLWAQGKQEHAKSASGNFSFRGESLYSYSTEVGRIVRAPGALCQPVALLTRRKYSVTTTRHVSLACSAANLPTVYVDLSRIAVDYAAELEQMHAGYRAEVARLKRNWQSYAQLFALETNIREFARLFQLELPTINRHIDILAIEEVRAARKTPEAIARREHEKAARALYTQRRNEKLLADWDAGRRQSLPDSAGMRLRVRNGDTLETSMGARVPLADAIKVFRMAAAARRAGTAIRPEQPVTVGDFRLTHIRENGTIVAGCHTIPWEESQRLAAVLKVEE